MTKDYYEVLGVRRSASAQEIELAFKGRRTQYHPDKYSAGDAETLQWATQHMQTVNEAYTVLSDPSRRSAYDRRRAGESQATPTSERSTSSSHASSPPAPPPASPPSPQQQATRPTASARTSLRDLLAKRFGERQFGRIYFTPHIPLKKLSAAMANYAGDVRPEEVLVLMDTTVFGGSKEGMLLTETALRLKEIGVPRRVVEWSTVTTIEASEGAVYVDSRKVMDCHMVDSNELMALFSVVGEFVRGQRERSDPQRPQRSQDTRSEQARDADRVVRPKPNPNQNSGKDKVEQMFRIAKEHLLELCRELEPYEKKSDTELIDRANAAGYFGYLNICANDPSDVPWILVELQLIADLCEEAMRRELTVPTEGRLLDAEEDDSDLVTELRWLLRARLDALEQKRREEEVDRFFRR